MILQAVLLICGVCLINHKVRDLKVRSKWCDCCDCSTSVFCSEVKGYSMLGEYDKAKPVKYKALWYLLSPAAERHTRHHGGQSTQFPDHEQSSGENHFNNHLQATEIALTYAKVETDDDSLILKRREYELFVPVVGVMLSCRQTCSSNSTKECSFLSALPFLLFMCIFFLLSPWANRP